MTEYSAPPSTPRPSFTVFAPFFPPAVDGGGPIRSLAALVSTSPWPHRVGTVTSDRDLRGAARLPVASNAWTRWQGHDIYYGSVDRPLGLLRLLLAAERLDNDVFYLNSFFDWRFSLLPQLMASLTRRGTKVLLAPRGEMGSGALSRRSHKKRVLIRLYRLLGQHKRVTFHATTPDETRDIRTIFGPDVQIIERTNQTLLPARAVETTDPPEVRMLFAGRVVPHKGLLTILEALRDLKPRVHLSVLGPEEDEAYARHCHNVARELHHEVVFQGSQPHEVILEEMSRATCLVLPTAGENFGHVLAESLSTLCPVLVSDTTPWSANIRSHGAGRVLADPQDVDAWRAALEELATATSTVRTAMRTGAAASYNAWQTSQGPHLFELYEEKFQPR